MPRPRVRSQLAIQAPPELLERLRAAAAARRCTATAFVIEAIEAALAAPGAGAGADGELRARVEALEAAVAALQQRPRPRPTPPVAVLEPQAQPLPLLEAQSHPRAELLREGQLTTAQLAAVLGMKRGSLNERLRRSGGAREGFELQGWRRVGRYQPSGGGPTQWVWEQLT